MLKKFSLIAVLSAVFCVSVYAAPFMSHNSRRAPQTLIVVGNYKTPRLMAATIKGLTSQPYLIISKDNRYYITLAKTTMEIPGDKLDVYINRLNPRRVVIIGDERYVTREQEDKLRKINTIRIPLVRIYGGDWGRIAEELDYMLNIGNLAREFRKNYRDHYMSDPKLRDPQAASSVTPAATPAAPEQGEKDEAGADDVPVSEPEQL